MNKMEFILDVGAGCCCPRHLRIAYYSNTGEHHIIHSYHPHIDAYNCVYSTEDLCQCHRPVVHPRDVQRVQPNNVNNEPSQSIVARFDHSALVGFLNMNSGLNLSVQRVWR